MESAEIRAALERRIQSRIAAEGTIRLPAIPAMADDYTERCSRLFAELGRPFTDDERAHLKTVISEQLSEAFNRSQRSSILISYTSRIANALEYTVTGHCLTIEEAYNEWIATREPPFFGVEPDARVCALASEAPNPGEHRILDIGAGTGRNALALARRGHPVDAVEMTTQFADILNAEAQSQALDLHVIRRDIFEPGEELRSDYGLIVASEVVPEFRTTTALRRLFELAARSLKSGGRLALNIFLTAPDYRPSEEARQFAQLAYSGFFTRPELDEATSDLPLELVDEDCVFDYERANLPDGAWPPTSWYEGWVSGQDIYAISRDKSPVNLRWLVYRRT